MKTVKKMAVSAVLIVMSVVMLAGCSTLSARKYVNELNDVMDDLNAAVTDYNAALLSYSASADSQASLDAIVNALETMQTEYKRILALDPPGDLAEVKTIFEEAGSELDKGVAAYKEAFKDGPVTDASTSEAQAAFIENVAIGDEALEEFQTLLTKAQNRINEINGVS